MKIPWHNKFRFKLFLMVVMVPIGILGIALFLGLDVVRDQIKIQYLDNLSLQTRALGVQLQTKITHQQVALDTVLKAEVLNLERKNTTGLLQGIPGHLYSEVIDKKNEETVKIFSSQSIEKDSLNPLLGHLKGSQYRVFIKNGISYLASNTDFETTQYKARSLVILSPDFFKSFSDKKSSYLITWDQSIVASINFDLSPKLQQEIQDVLIDKMKGKSYGTINIETKADKWLVSFSSLAQDNNFIIQVFEDKYVDSIFSAMTDRAALTLLIILSSLILLSLYVSSYFSKNIESINETLDEIAKGNLEQNLVLSGNDEFSQLANSITNMSKEIKKQFQIITKKDQELKSAEHLATTDKMTGLNNYLAFQEFIHSILNDDKNSGSSFALFMLDIDHFKKFNDTYGHLQGDEVLKQVAGTMKKSAQKGQFIGRYGGEEFISVFPTSELETLTQVMEKFRLNIEFTKVDNINEPGQNLSVTASFGGVVFPVLDFSNKDKAINFIIEKADQQLYLSKEKGRNTHSSAKISTQDFHAEELAKF